MDHEEGSVLYMAGGEWPDQNPNETFWQFNSVLDEWKELNSLLTPRSELGKNILSHLIFQIIKISGLNLFYFF